MAKKIKKTFKNLFSVTLPTILILFILLELFFRLVIPANNPPNGYFYEDEGIYSYNNKRKDGIYTIGRFAEIRSKWHINNMSWNYPIDYYPVKDKKLIAVIGDSFIEAFQVDVDKKYPFLLREKLGEDFEVFAFGKSGYPLSQYLYISRYINKYFEPDILIFNIIHNDFYESIYEFQPNRHYFFQLSIEPSDSTFMETDPTPNYSFPQYNLLKRLLYKSSTFRYLYLNLQVKQMLQKKENNVIEENLDIKNIENNKQIIIDATDHIIAKIKEENKGKRIIFISDAPRNAIYNNKLKESNVLWMNKMMKDICFSNSVEYIDLTETMLLDYKKNKKKFNSELDGHWNEYGHSFVADFLYNYLQNIN